MDVGGGGEGERVENRMKEEIECKRKDGGERKKEKCEERVRSNEE